MGPYGQAGRCCAKQTLGNTCSLGSTSVAGLLGGSLCIPPCRGTWNTTQLGACTHREHANMGVHTLGELLDHAYPEQVCWCPGPCPVPPMCGALRAARMMAPPASMALGKHSMAMFHLWAPDGWGPKQQGQRLPGSTPAFPRSPKFLPWGPPCQACVLRGALPAPPPS